MAKKNKYVLIAKYNNSSDFKIISLNGSNVQKLEEIDFYTLDFKDKEDLVNALYKSGKIDNTDVDIFIAWGKDKEKEVRFMEPLYSKNILIKDLLGVIAQSLKKEDSDKKCYDHILKEFEKRVLNSPGFYSLVAKEETNLYGKFSGYIKTTRKYNGFLGNKKDLAWVYNSYPLMRNIVETINRYDELVKTNKPVWQENSRIYCENKKNRRNIIPILADKFRDENITGQISMFDNFNIDIVEAPKVVEIKEPPRVAKIPKLNWEEEIEKYSNVNVKDKLKMVRAVLFNLPRRAIEIKTVNGEHKGLKFNEDIFECYPDEKSKKILKTGLKAPLMKLVNLCLIHRYGYEFEHENDFDGYEEYQELEYYKKKITYLLKKDKNNYEILNRAYVWCKTYVDCFEKNLEINNSIDNADDTIKIK